MNMNMTLTRDPRYTAEKRKLEEFQHELSKLETERNDVLNQINRSDKPKKSKLDLRAEAILAGGVDAELPTGANQAHKTYAQLSEKIVVLLHAIGMQKQIVAELAAEASKEITLEALPQHKKNVFAIAVAAIKLSEALAAEAKLRDDLLQNDVNYLSHIRPMAFRGVGSLSDGQSAVSRYLLECYEHGFLTKRELPDCLEKYIPSKAAPAKPVIASRVDNDGWLHA